MFYSPDQRLVGGFTFTYVGLEIRLCGHGELTLAPWTYPATSCQIDSIDQTLVLPLS